MLKVSGTRHSPGMAAPALAADRHPRPAGAAGRPMVTLELPAGTHTCAAGRRSGPRPARPAGDVGVDHRHRPMPTPVRPAGRPALDFPAVGAAEAPGLRPCRGCLPDGQEMERARHPGKAEVRSARYGVDVREPDHPAHRRLRPPQAARRAERGRRRRGDARDPHRAARGRRGAAGGQGLRRPGARARGRPGGDQEHHPRPDGGQDRPRRAGGDPGRRRQRAAASARRPPWS